MHSNEAVQTTNVDTELDYKVKKSCEKISENLHIVANEPSLACYRLQEHIRKSLPQLVEKRLEVNTVHQELQGKCYDLEYSVSALKSIQGSQQHFLNIQELIKNAMFMKQQLSYEESLKTDKKTQPSMYQRFSGSFDLPSSFLPSMSGLSTSLSASADLKSSPLPPRVSASPNRRARASSVSSSHTRPSSTPKRILHASHSQEGKSTSGTSH
ncbi:BLOC-1-related complex subunit 8 homolog [Centruroides vittatus]|uniref:BLOC-1-related complex subunit 8 homolog n=1 Tax=Centruroides vittatus TaxID=120091 RepID=UPI00350FCCCD